jgi:hypothetical protein
MIGGEGDLEWWQAQREENRDQDEDGSQLMRGRLLGPETPEFNV